MLRVDKKVYGSAKGGMDFNVKEWEVWKKGKIEKAVCHAMKGGSGLTTHC
jgi:hypothetical protein